MFKIVMCLVVRCLLAGISFTGERIKAQCLNVNESLVKRDSYLNIAYSIIPCIDLFSPNLNLS